MAFTTALGRFVGIDDMAHELAADDVRSGEGDMIDLLESLQDADRFEQA